MLNGARSCDNFQQDLKSQDPCKIKKVKGILIYDKFAFDYYNHKY